MKFSFLLLLAFIACGRGGTHRDARLERNEEPLSSKPTYECNFEGIRSLDIPLYPDRENSPKVNYKYQIIGDFDPEKLLLVYLPGGPGRSSINDYADPDVLKKKTNSGVPKGLPYLFIDPRTVGCNWGDEETYPDDSLRSDYLASDVLAVLKELKVKKYIIWGHSYGSQAATFVAGQAEKGEGPRPNAILLSGVLGRGEADGSFAMKEQFKLEWNLIKPQLKPETIELLKLEEPLGYKSRVWENMISEAMKAGSILRNFSDAPPRFEHPLLTRLKNFETGNSVSLFWILDAYAAPVVPSRNVSHRSARLFDNVDCKEFSPHDNGFYFENAEFVDNPYYLNCESKPFDRPYDSAKLLTSSPIYYIIGTNDPAAPYKGAQYHYENQTRSHRNVIEFKGSGHVVMGDVLWDCQDKLWESILKLEDLTEPLKTCKAPFKHTILPAI